MTEQARRYDISVKIKTLLQNFNAHDKTDEKRGIYIYGITGVGKTTFIMSIIEELDFDKVVYDSGECRDKLFLNTLGQDSNSNMNVMSLLHKKPKKMVVVIDDVNELCNAENKGAVGTLIKLIRTKRTKKQKKESKSTSQIICIGNYFMDKKLKELMKLCHVFELCPFTDNEMKLKLYESIGLSHDFITDFIGRDLRKLHFVIKLYNSNPKLITEDVLSVFKQTELKETVKNITQHIIENPISFNEHYQVINNSERQLVSLLLYENLTEIPTEMHQYVSALENMCLSDFIAHNDTERASTINTFYTLKKLHIDQTPQIKFTRVLSKYATECANTAFVKRLCETFRMDKKDLVVYFHEMRIREKEIVHDDVCKLDIKRFYRFINKQYYAEVEIDEENVDFLLTINEDMF